MSFWHKRLRSAIAEFLADEEGGERDALGTLLILALIIIPLILVIIFFGNQIVEYSKGKWEEVMGSPVQN